MMLVVWPYAADWQDRANIAAVLGVIIALLVGIATTVVMIRQEKVTREGYRFQQKQAETAALRSEAAAALTEEYTRRVVEALEEIAQSGGNGTTNIINNPPARTGVRWTLIHQRGHRYVLTNAGDESADQVEISAHETLALLDVPNGPVVVGPGEAVSFIAARSLATEDSTIRVSWLDQSNNDAKTWKYPLPPAP